ncbi:hypothetical protein WN48_02901 [Eufriesea mexicana]|nr:hypothetical protein WN48_02901 [Eufriesea mexicana]
MLGTVPLLGSSLVLGAISSFRFFVWVHVVRYIDTNIGKNIDSVTIPWYLRASTGGCWVIKITN